MFLGIKSCPPIDWGEADARICTAVAEQQTLDLEHLQHFCVKIGDFGTAAFQSKEAERCAMRRLFPQADAEDENIPFFKDEKRRLFPRAGVYPQDESSPEHDRLRTLSSVSTADTMTGESSPPTTDGEGAKRQRKLSLDKEKIVSLEEIEKRQEREHRELVYNSLVTDYPTGVVGNEGVVGGADNAGIVGAGIVDPTVATLLACYGGKGPLSLPPDERTLCGGLFRRDHAAGPVGTWPILAPEIRMGGVGNAADGSRAADMFSVGIIIANLVLGVRVVDRVMDLEEVKGAVAEWPGGLNGSTG